MKINIDVVIVGIDPNSTAQIFRNEATVGYCFINTGNTPVQINNFVLLPNSTWKTFEAGVEDMTIYRVKFNQNNNLYGGCGTDRSVLTVLIYSKV